MGQIVQPEFGLRKDFKTCPCNALYSFRLYRKLCIKRNLGPILSRQGYQPEVPENRRLPCACARSLSLFHRMIIQGQQRKYSGMNVKSNCSSLCCLLGPCFGVSHTCRRDVQNKHVCHLRLLSAPKGTLNLSYGGTDIQFGTFSDTRKRTMTWQKKKKKKVKLIQSRRVDYFKAFREKLAHKYANTQIFRYWDLLLFFSYQQVPCT